MGPVFKDQTRLDFKPSYSSAWQLTRLIGAQSLAARLANILPKGGVIVSAPVREIEQNSDLCIVTTADGRIFRSQKVTVSTPTTAHHDIEFHGTINKPFPSAKKALADRAISGYHTKVVLT